MTLHSSCLTRQGHLPLIRVITTKMFLFALKYAYSTLAILCEDITSIFFRQGALDRLLFHCFNLCFIFRQGAYIGYVCSTCCRSSSTCGESITGCSSPGAPTTAPCVARAAMWPRAFTSCVVSAGSTAASPSRQNLERCEPRRTSQSSSGSLSPPSSR